MGKETAAILLISVVHLVGVAVLLWAMMGSDRADWRGWWPRDDEPPEPPTPVTPPPSGGGLPLPVSQPAGLRLRSGHDRLADAHRRARRPDHVPGREREPA